MEKKLYDLKVDPELRELIPPLSDEERYMLEESIVRDGCDTPLAVWNGTIVDGHNRYEICHAHGIPFGIEEKDFPDKDAAMFWMLERQLARRNLNSYQRSQIGLKYESFYREQAKKRQATLSGGSNPQLLQNSAEAEKGNAMDKLGKMVGVSRDTLAKVKELDANADDRTKEKLRKGEVSIHRAYTDMKNKEHEGQTRVCESCGEEKPFSDFSIPSKSKEYRPICKKCEEKSKAAAKAAEKAAYLPGPPSVTGIGVRNGQIALVSTGLPDDPGMFSHVIDLFKHSQNAYLVAFEATLANYHPSMITEEHNEMIRQMIDYVAETTEKMLDQHLNAQKEEK